MGKSDQRKPGSPFPTSLDSGPTKSYSRKARPGCAFSHSSSFWPLRLQPKMATEVTESSRICLTYLLGRCRILQIKSSQCYRVFTSRSQNPPHLFRHTTIQPTSNRERLSTLALTSISTQWEKDLTL